MADIVEVIYADHFWFRQYFLYLDGAKTESELRAIWEPLAQRLEVHAAAEEQILYPALLALGRAGDPKAETEDAVKDHNEIRDAIRAARACSVGTEDWFKAVGEARTQNGKHLDEEEREALPDFVQSTAADERHELAMQWLKFVHEHEGGAGISTADKDPKRYVADKS